uniref:Olfactory receptor n=1 Tax=Ictidomys tridecemlineatus TaxID=43179 RepID=I3LWP9_ICTTR
MRNHTAITTFILLGLTDDPKLKVLLFIFLLLTYMLSVTGNLTIITLTLVDPHLKTPMYFFLRNFSFLEVSFTTVCIPRFLYSLSTGDNTVTYNACATQIFFVFLFGATEFFLLAAMSYDRYVAICKPLHYMTIMNNRVCTLLVLSCWLLACWLVIFPPLILGLNIDFYASNVVDHFYRDTTPLMQISCTDIQLLEMMGFISVLVTLLVTLVMMMVSYTYVALIILRIPSISQRKKAFSTCSSHMIMISLSYGSCFFIYLKPSIKQRTSFSKGIAVLNTSVAPLLNTFIYTLWNQQVKKIVSFSTKLMFYFVIQRI